MILTSLPSLLLLLPLFNLLTPNQAQSLKAEANQDGSLPTAADIIESRGFRAEQHYVKTSDGYVLSLVRANNPLLVANEPELAQKDAILFVHGLFANSLSYLMNSAGAKPRDLSHLSAARMSIGQLRRLFSGDNSSNSLPFTALNFGHEVWLLDRRSTSRSSSLSLAAAGEPWLLAFESERYYNFTIDQQAQFDFPQTLGYVLSQTRRKRLSYVGHSMGGALPLMALSLRPELASQINKLMLWAPATNLGGKLKYTFLRSISQTLARHPLPVPPIFLLPAGRDFLSSVCDTKLGQQGLCKVAVDFFVGPAGGQHSIDPSFTKAIDSASTMEVAQLMQWFIMGRTHFFDFGDQQRNRCAYGSAYPPPYDFSRIKLLGKRALSIWWGAEDSMVQPDAVRSTLSQLGVSVEKHLINMNDSLFNHMSFMLHEEVSSLLILPAMKSLQSE